jgi:hypothetical protein
MVWKLTVLALIGLVLAAGLCAFDDDGAGIDLCNVAAVIVAAILVAVSLLAAGRLELRPLSGYLAALPDLPVPPPRA